MKIATTTSDFEKYCQTDEECIKQLHLVGFRYIDFSLYNTETVNRVYNDRNWQAEADKLRNSADKLGMQFVQAHSPGGNPLQKDAAWDADLKATIRSIEICGMLGIKNTVVHAGWRQGVNKEEWQKENLAYYRLLFPAMEKWGVNVLVENSTKANMRDMYYVNSGKEILEFAEYVNHPLINICWDTGHANCEGSQYEDILTLGKRLYAIHYNDNHGTSDEHIIPYTGTLNHDEVICALREIGFNGYFTLECNSTIIGTSGYRPRRKFEKDTRLAEPPLFLQQELEKALYDTAKYMLEQYGLFEE